MSTMRWRPAWAIAVVAALLLATLTAFGLQCGNILDSGPWAVVVLIIVAPALATELALVVLEIVFLVRGGRGLFYATYIAAVVAGIGGYVILTRG